MKQLTKFPPVLQRLVSDLSDQELLQAQISVGVLRDCRAITTTQIGISLAVSVGIDVSSFRSEPVLLIRLPVDQAHWAVVLRETDRRIVAASMEPPKMVMTELAKLGFEFGWSSEIVGRHVSLNPNAFTEFVKLADQRGYCWKIGCSPCGSFDFRSGLLLLSAGVEPDTDQWIKLKKLLKASPKSLRYADAYDESFCNLLREVSFADLSATCRFPDWLGYLGLALSDMSSVRTLFVSDLRRDWAIQFSKLMPTGSKVADQISRLGEPDQRFLSWRDLSLVEEALNNQPGGQSHSKGGRG